MGFERMSCFRKPGREKEQKQEDRMKSRVPSPGSPQLAQYVQPAVEENMG
jgi:hypothetical protein